jgi:hypothetical protein
VRPEVGIVVFDSQVAIGAGQGVYMSAVAKLLKGGGVPDQAGQVQDVSASVRAVGVYLVVGGDRLFRDDAITAELEAGAERPVPDFGCAGLPS